MRSSVPALAAVLAVALAGCDTTFPWTGGATGGGGGGASLSVSPRTLSFSARQGGATPGAKTATLTITGTVYVGLAYAGAAVESAYWNQTSGTTGQITVSPMAPTAAGHHTGSVTVVGCADQVCSRQVAGSPAVIDVSYDVEPITLSVSPTSITFDYVVGGAVPVPVSLQVADSAGGGYTATTSYTGGWLVLDRSAGTVPDTITVSVNPSNAYPGTRTANIAVTSAAGTLNVPVTLTVSQPAIHPAPAALAFQAISGQTAAPDAQTVTLSTDEDLPVSFTAYVLYGAGPSGWLSVPASGTAPSAVSVRPSTAALAAGTYTATLRLSPSNFGSIVDVPVTYTLSAPSLQVSPASAAFTVTSASTPGDMSRTVNVSSPGTPLAWSATSTAGWLAVSPGSATGAAPLSLSLVSSGLAKLANGSHSAAVVLVYTDPSGPAVEVRVPVTLSISLSRIDLASPHVEVAGTTGETILRGDLLSGVTEVDFGGTPVAVTAVSATELRVTVPGLAAGTYRVRIPNALGLDLGADVVVVDAKTRTAAWVPSGGTKRRILFDDARNAVYAATSGTVERFRESNGWARETISLASVRDIALSPDGTRLVAVAGANVWEIDPDAFVLPAQPAATVAEGVDWRIAFANDGAGIMAGSVISYSGFAGCAKYDFLRKQASPTLPGCNYYGGRVGGSVDGRRVVVGGNGLSPPQPIGHYDASAGAFQSSSVGYAMGPIALDRTASRVLLSGYSVRNASYAELGTLPLVFGTVLSRDGTRAYGWDVDRLKVRAFDLAAAPVSGVYPELGPAGGTAPVASPGQFVQGALSADGRTLFVAGDTNLVVQPLP